MSSPTPSYDFALGEVFDARRCQIFIFCTYPISELPALTLCWLQSGERLFLTVYPGQCREEEFPAAAPILDLYWGITSYVQSSVGFLSGRLMISAFPSVCFPGAEGICTLQETARGHY